MKIITKIFGELEIDEEKVIHFETGIIGFPEMNHFVLLHDSQKEGSGLRWLQSVEEPGFAMPVMDPLIVAPDYNPQVEDQMLERIGTLGSESLLVLTVVTVPGKIEEMTVNLQGPIIINVDSHKAIQIIVDADKYPVRYPVYELLKARKEG